MEKSTQVDVIHIQIVVSDDVQIFDVIELVLIVLLILELGVVRSEHCIAFYFWYLYIHHILKCPVEVCVVRKTFRQVRFEILEVGAGDDASGKFIGSDGRDDGFKRWDLCEEFDLL